MRHLISIFAAMIMITGTAQARDLPTGLATRIVQGVHACMAFYERGESIGSLSAKGFEAKARWMEVDVDLSAETGSKRRYWVRVLIEHTYECEIHSNFKRMNIARDAFKLAKAAMAESGFVITKGQRHADRAKSIAEKGPVSIYFKVRDWESALKVKYLARSR